MKKKRSQVTIFLILVVSLIIAVSAIIVIDKNSAKNLSDIVISNAKETAFDIQPIKKFVDGCLSIASEDGLRKLGNQNGNLFISQGGLIAGFSDDEEGKKFVNHDGYKVAFGIKDEPKLRKEEGQNSIQEQLAVFVKNNINNCLDFSAFEKQGFEISKKESTINVGINEESISFSMSYPIIISKPSSGTKTEINAFFITQDIRLAKIYAFVNQIIGLEDISDEKDFTARIEKNSSKHNEVVVVTDKKSSIGGVPYSYVFARKAIDASLGLVTGVAILDFGNTIPTADAGRNRNVKVSEETKLFGSGSDDDEDAITFKWQMVDKPGGSTAFLSKDNTPNPYFTPDLEGAYTFRLRTNDGKSFSNPSTVVITSKAADPTNTKPISYANESRNVNIGQKITLPGIGTDSDGDQLAYMWGVLNYPKGGNNWLLNSNIQSPVFIPNIAGNYIFYLIVNDGKEDSNTSQVSITASLPGTNRAPSADPGYDKSVKAGDTATLLGAGSDPDNDPLTFSWGVVTKPTASSSSLSDSNIANPTFNFDVGGNYTFSLIVDDGKLYSPSNTVKYAAKAVTGNNKPTANAGVNRQVNLGEETELQGIGSDADRDILSYRWAVASTPAGTSITLSNPNSQNPKFTATAKGDYIFALAVNDGKEDSASSQVSITASLPGTNRAPSADPGYDKSVKAGDTATLLGAGSDPDNDPLTFSWSVITKPTGSESAVSNKNIANPTFIPDVEGEYTFNLGVSDGKIDSPSNTVKYVAKAVTGNNKPTANAGVNRQVNLGEETELQGIGSDADRDILSYRWAVTSTPAGTSITLSNPNSQNPKFTTTAKGDYIFALAVNDGKEDSGIASVVISSIDPGQPCIEGTCDAKNKKWCSKGKLLSGGYCDICGNYDSTCPACTGNVCDTTNKKWCEKGVWASGEYSQYCSRCNYADKSCPLCAAGACDTAKRRWCDNNKWSVIDYCIKCSAVDSSCKTINSTCKTGTCDTKNKGWCNNGAWDTSNYCANCGKIDSSCYFECSNNECDVKNKKWCNNRTWASTNYCANCGSKDFSCASACQNNVCDTISNKWCSSSSWESINYCDHCQDSDCLNVCTNNACDISPQKWCNNSIWASTNYCSNCGAKDSLCSASCKEDTCDISANKRCSAERWVSTSYCGNCVLIDSDCTILCAEGECDKASKKVCISSIWTNISYEAYCITAPATPNNVSGKCSDYGNCTIDSPCSNNNECLSRLCFNNKCSNISCSDNIENGNETDVDCGSSCNKCGNGKKCSTDSDCSSLLCQSGLCGDKNTCDDKKLNGNETDVDCGGPCENKCLLGKRCSTDPDCDPSLSCLSSICSQITNDIKKKGKDTDGDGIPDEWEIKYGLNPQSNSDAASDFDKDGLANLQEYTLGTNPTLADSDNDGVSDKLEIDKGTNPLDAVSKPGGIGGVLFVALMLILLFGAGSYIVYYYKDYLKPEPKLPAPIPGPVIIPKSALKQMQEKPSLNFEKEKIQDIVRRRREEKEGKRQEILGSFSGYNKGHGQEPKLTISEIFNKGKGGKTR